VRNKRGPLECFWRKAASEGTNRTNDKRSTRNAVQGDQEVYSPNSKAGEVAKRRVCNLHTNILDNKKKGKRDDWLIHPENARARQGGV
jgi:hypothetical protein